MLIFGERSWADYGPGGDDVEDPRMPRVEPPVVASDAPYPFLPPVTHRSFSLHLRVARVDHELRQHRPALDVRVECHGGHLECVAQPPDRDSFKALLASKRDSGLDDMVCRQP
jgi:hypothetical protein